MSSFIHHVVLRDLRVCLWTPREFPFSVSDIILLITTSTGNNSQKKEIWTLSFSFIMNIKISVNFYFTFKNYVDI